MLRRSGGWDGEIGRGVGSLHRRGGARIESRIGRSGLGRLLDRRRLRGTRRNL